MKAPLPANERQRLEALRHYDVLDTPPEAAFDELTQLAAHVCDAPIALISLVDEQRQWFKSRIGLTQAETQRDIAFCAHTILQPDLLIVPDATQDERFRDIPLVTAEPRIRFYAGAPLVTSGGHALGTLCVLDRQPRQLSAEQQAALRVLSRHVVTVLEFRRQARALAQAQVERERAEAARCQAEAELERRVRERATAFEYARTILPAQRAGRFLALKIAGTYALVGALYILLSDRLIGTLIQDKDMLIRAAIYKGWGFIAVTAALLAWGLGRYLGRIRRAEAETRESEKRFRLLVSGVHDHAILMLDSTGRVTSWNVGAERIYGYRAAEILGKRFSCFYPAEDVAVGRADSALRTAEINGYFEEDGWRLRKNGRSFWASATLTALRDDTGRLQGFAKVTRDITERRQAQEELRRTNRALRAIGECNHAVMRAATEPELLREVCRIIVEQAGYRLAWVGFALHDEARSVQPAAQAGYEEGYLETVRVSWADTERGRGPVGMAIRTGQHFVVQNTATEPFFTPWRAEAGRRGYTSVLALPLITGGKTIGALTIYAEEPDAFDGPELTLLTELANDLVFGLAALRLRVEQQQAQQALRDSEAKYRALLETIPYGVQENDLTGTVTFSNSAYALMHGLPPGSMIGRKIWDRLEEESVQRDLQFMLQRMIKERPAPTTYHSRNRTADGRFIDVAVDWNYRFDDLGNLIGFLSVITDITERKLIEEKLRDSEEHYRRLIETSPESIALTDTTGRVTFVSPRIFELFDAPPDTPVLGLSVLNWIAPEDHERARAAIGQVLASRQPGTPGEFRLLKHDRTPFWGELVSTPIFDAQRNIKGMMTLLRDISKRRQAEEDLRAAHQRLQSLSRHLVEVQEAERRHLARELHDEIGQGLTAFKMNLQGLQSAPDPATHQKLVGQGITFVDHLLQEVRDLSLNLRPPMLDDLGLPPALRWLVDQAGRKAGFKTQMAIDPKLARLHPALETACFRIIQEALTNVARHAHASEVAIELRLDDGALHLAVRDNGQGFDYAAARQRAHKGASLGLEAMEERVSLLDGRLECQSAPGQGTTLRAVFPLQTKASSS